MVYLIATEDLTYAKIGFTGGKINARLSMLQTGSPIGLSIIDTIDGDMVVEKYLHAKCNHLHVRLEWFKHCDELLQIFSSSKEVPYAEIKDFVEGLNKVKPIVDYIDMFNPEDGSIILLTEVASMTNIEFVDKIVYSYVIGFNINSKEFSLPNETVCNNLGINLLTLRRSIARLQEKGFLLIFNKVNNRNGSINARVLECANKYAKDVRRDTDRYTYKSITYSGKYLSQKSQMSDKLIVD